VVPDHGFRTVDLAIDAAATPSCRRFRRGSGICRQRQPPNPRRALGEVSRLMSSITTRSHRKAVNSPAPRLRNILPEAQPERYALEPSVVIDDIKRDTPPRVTTRIGGWRLVGKFPNRVETAGTKESRASIANRRSKTVSETTMRSVSVRAFFAFRAASTFARWRRCL